MMSKKKVYYLEEDKEKRPKADYSLIKWVYRFDGKHEFSQAFKELIALYVWKN